MCRPRFSVSSCRAIHLSAVATRGMSSARPAAMQSAEKIGPPGPPFSLASGRADSPRAASEGSGASASTAVWIARVNDEQVSGVSG